MLSIYISDTQRERENPILRERRQKKKAYCMCSVSNTEREREREREEEEEEEAENTESFLEFCKLIPHLLSNFLFPHVLSSNHFSLGLKDHILFKCDI